MPAPRPAAPPSPGTATGEPRPTTRCPGCGSVLVPLPGEPAARPGASAACTRLFEETVRGLRDDPAPDGTAPPALALAEAAYAAQHPDPADPPALRAALAALGGGPADPLPARPREWTTTIADVAADLDVIDLTVLVETWATAVADDWRHAPTG
ncbi:hypothetical protein GCM10027261_19660 [Geodermatophilus arenarius]|uniref:DUF5946 family protein n=1 Tax=Geodermatophilus arenarius TaxID=1137990 RepID=A0ABV9LIM6_9ACTN